MTKSKRGPLPIYYPSVNDTHIYDLVRVHEGALTYSSINNSTQFLEERLGVSSERVKSQKFCIYRRTNLFTEAQTLNSSLLTLQQCRILLFHESEERLRGGTGPGDKWTSDRFKQRQH